MVFLWSSSMQSPLWQSPFWRTSGTWLQSRWSTQPTSVRQNMMFKHEKRWDDELAEFQHSLTVPWYLLRKGITSQFAAQLLLGSTHTKPPQFRPSLVVGALGATNGSTCLARFSSPCLGSQVITASSFWGLGEGGASALKTNGFGSKKGNYLNTPDR